MDDEGTTSVDARTASRADAGYGLPASTWYGVAAIGVILFVLGIWLPAWKGVPGGIGLNYVVAAAGGVLFIAGLTLAARARSAARPTPVVEMAGVEVYRPGTRPRIEPAEPDEDQA
jgi:hypothetical protein